MAEPSIGMLYAMGQGYMPMAPGLSPQRRFGFENVPGFGSPLGFLMQAPASRMMSQVGMAPMGLNDQNIYDTMMHQRFTQLQMQAMRHTAEIDRAGIMQGFRGVAAMTGAPWGAEQRRAAQSLTDAAVHFAPIFAEMMPDFMDELGGAKGSATVLASRLMQAGRYRVDPVTGRTGYSPETAGGQATQIYRELYGASAARDMHGIRAGQLGGIFQELQSRGMMRTAASEAAFGGGLRAGDRSSEVARAIEDARHSDNTRLMEVGKSHGVDLSKGVGSLGGAQLDKLAADPMISDRLRSFDVERVKRSLQAYSKAVAAVRDVFGDAGQPNAPMAELMRGLEALTMGSMHQIDPARLSGIVRQTQNLARSTGMPMDSAMMLQQHIAGRAASMGLEPMDAVQATQGAMADAGAFRALGFGSVPAWGAYNSDQMAQLHGELRIQARDSPMAMRLGTAMRIRSRMGGFKPGSAAEAYTEAARMGLDAFTFGKDVRSMNVGEAEFMRMMTQDSVGVGGSGGISEATVRSLMADRLGTGEQISEHDLGALVKRHQRGELTKFAGYRFQESLQTQLQAHWKSLGLTTTNAQAQAMAGPIAQRAAERMALLSPDQRSPANFGASLGAILEGEFGTIQGAVALRGMTPEQKTRFLAQVGEAANANLARGIESDPQMSRFKTAQNFYNAIDPAAMAESDRKSLESKLTGKMQDAFSHMHGTMLSRAAEAIRKVRPGDEDAFKVVLAQAFGGVSKKEITRALAGPMNELKTLNWQAEELKTRILSTTDSAEKAKLMAQFDSVQATATAMSKSLNRTGEQYGDAIGDGGLDPAEVTRAITSHGKLGVEANRLAKLPGYGTRDFDWAGYWKGTEGRAFRQHVDESDQDAEGLTSGLLSSQAMIQKIGPHAFTMYAARRADQQREMLLTHKYYGGDRARYYAKDLDKSVNRETGLAVVNEQTDIEDRKVEFMGQLDSKLSKEGSNWQLTPEARAAAARELFGGKGPFSALNVAVGTRLLGLSEQLAPEDRVAIKNASWWDTRESDSWWDPRGLKKLGERLGATREELLAIPNVEQAMEAQRVKYLTYDTMTGSKMAKAIAKVYGVREAGDEQNTTFDKYDVLFQGSKAKQFAQTALATKELVAATAKAGGAVDEAAMYKDYADATNVPSTPEDEVEKFRAADSFIKKYKLGESGDYAKFQKAAEWQQAHGLDRAGGAPLRQRLGEWHDAMKRGLEGGVEYRGGEAAPGTPGGADRTVISGTVSVSFKDKTLEFIDAQGTRNHLRPA